MPMLPQYGFDEFSIRQPDKNILHGVLRTNARLSTSRAFTGIRLFVWVFASASNA
jgi:hypothetical protein